MRLKLEILVVNLQSEEVHGHPPPKSTNEIRTMVEVKVKTKWAYVTLPLPMAMTTNSSTPITLPSFMPSSKDEPLVLFIEVWKSGHFEGLAEFNLRELLGKNPGEDTVKWLQIWCPIRNKVKGKLMLRLEDEEVSGLPSIETLEPTRLRSSAVVQLLSDEESRRNRHRPSSPMSSSYFPHSNASGSSPMTSASSSASTVTVLTAQSSPAKVIRKSPELDELDIIEILNNKLELLRGSYQESKGNPNRVTPQSSHRHGSQKGVGVNKGTSSVGTVIPQTVSQGLNPGGPGRSTEGFVASVKVKNSIMPQKRRMAANFTHPNQPTNQRGAKGNTTK